MKVCTRCKEEKQESEFGKNKNTTDGFLSRCKSCDIRKDPEARRKRWELEGGKIPTKVAQELKSQGLRRCPGCRSIKKIDQFYSDKAAHCILCMNEMSRKRPPEEKKEYYKKKRLQFRSSILLRKFGITLDQYNELLKSQDNKCAICGISPEQNGKALAVDHNHKTGIVRSLLCGCCNAAVGFLKENSDLAIKVSEYIRKHKVL